MNRRTFMTSAGRSAMATGATLLGAPAVHTQPKYVWKMVTTWPKDLPGVWTGASRLARAIESMSEKRITITVYGAEEFIPAFDTFDAVASGKAELGHSAAYYWQKKHAAMPFFATVPFGFNAQEMAAWLHYGGGQALWDELYAPFHVKPFAAGSTGVQMGGWFNKEITTVKDLEGLKMRMPGLGGDILARLGVHIVNLPGGEIHPALKAGSIDAAEWIGPYNDLALGLHQVARYYYWPGWHEPGTVVELLINRRIYEALPSDMQEIIVQATKAAYNDMLAEYTLRNTDALTELVRTHKVQLRQFPNPMLGTLSKLSREVIAAVAAYDPLARKVYEAFHALRQKAIDWTQIGEEAYSVARTLTFLSPP